LRLQPEISVTPPAEALGRESAVVLVVDVQEAFRRHVPGFEELTRRVALLVEGAGLLDVPVVASEQYPHGLGPTASELDGPLGDAERLEKRAFSAVRAAGFDDLARRLGRRQWILCGLEAHVCVHQTAADLGRRGFAVHLAADAVGARHAQDRELGIARTLADGAHASSVEMALFELLGDADAPAFRGVQAAIKRHAPSPAEPVGAR
jgi:nicotinamidase-related amidase